MTEDNPSVRERIGEAGESVKSAASRAGQTARSGAKRAAESKAARKAKSGTVKAGKATVEAGDKLREGAIEAAKEAAKPPDPNEISLSELDSAVNRVQDRQTLLRMLELEEEGRNRSSARQIIRDRLDAVEMEPQADAGGLGQGFDFFGLEEGEGIGVSMSGFGDDERDPVVESVTFTGEEPDEAFDDVMFGTETDNVEDDWLRW